MKNQAISTGLHWVDAPCPRCGELETIAIVLTSVLTTPQDDSPSLKVRAKSKGLDHDCTQTRIGGKP